MRAFLDLRPAIYSAVQPLLEHDNADIREAALVTALPLPEHPALAPHRDELVAPARRLLKSSIDRYKRDRVLEALTVWGHDISGLETADDMAVREREPGESPSYGREAAPKTRPSDSGPP
ncbi:hypothetical protein ACF1GY_32995 [Streptomyces sp. NPDC014684]|uniref:hypothetical protein n=1 Tax=Streptomyces sp. NPDC014684 TaxID=3364880 RepID=UPI003701CCB1